MFTRIKNQSSKLLLFVILFCILLILSGCIYVPRYKPEKIQTEDIIQDRSAVYLLDNADVFVQPSGISTTTIHQKILVTGEKGKRHGTLQISYNDDRQTIEIIEAKTITPEGNILHVRKSDIRTVTPAELSHFSVLYPGIKVCTVTFPAVGPGSIIEYIYKIETKKPIMPGAFWDGFFFQDTEPFMYSKYRITVPENMRLYFFPFSVELKEKTKKGKFITYEYLKTNMPAIIPEEMMPPISELVPRVLVTTIKDWDEIGRWFYNLSKDTTIPDSNIKATTSRIVQGAKTDEEKIKAIYHFICKNIRYIGLELGIHGFKPHDAKDVLKSGYGDCKDKAALMVAMLKCVGIKSYIALINTERQIEENIPFPGQFNHAIVAVQRENDFLILDPTSQVIPYPELPPSDQNKPVLIPTEDKTIMVKSYCAKPEENQKKRHIVASFDSSGNLEANVSVYINGIYAASLRNTFRYLSEEERKRELSRSLNRIIPNTTLKQFIIENIDSLDQPINQRYTFGSKKYATILQKKMLFNPALLEKIEGTELTSLEKRNFPIRLPFKRSNIDLIVFHLPENYVVDAHPESVKIETKFGKYSTSFIVDDNKLIYERTLFFDILEISPEDYQEFKKFYEQIAHNDSLPVILKEKTS
ncbi:MAG: DUF3857 domain-containing protein [Candidatus Omnitrophica bacterium]|nr:DUF3857 domain-containing protein [Candidatus Omnitrophota bacterium]